MRNYGTLQTVKYVLAFALILSNPVISNAGPSIGQINEIQGLDGLKEHRIISVPNNEVDDKELKHLKNLIKSCPNCQDIPEIDGPSEPIKVTPKPSKTPSDFCKKYPGKFGCP